MQLGKCWMTTAGVKCQRLVICATVLSLTGKAMAVTNYVWEASPNTQSPYTTWDTAAHHIQDAVNAAVANDTVLVRPGTYTVPTNAVHLAEAGYEIGTNVVFVNKPLVLRSTDGAATTIIDGEGAYRGVAFWNIHTTTTNRFALDGFTVTNGFASQMGGGVLFYHRDQVWTGEVLNSIIVSNSVAWGTNAFPDVHAKIANGSYGGGICSYCYANNSSLIISNSILRSNHARQGWNDPVNDSAQGATGGGCWLRLDGPAHLLDSLVEYNTSQGRAGGLHISRSKSIILERSTIRNNQALPTGHWNILNLFAAGGMETSQSQVKFRIRNCLFTDNYAYSYGGAIALWPATGSIENTTITRNTAVMRNTSGGISSAATVAVVNSIIYDNLGGNLRLDAASEPVFTNCLTSPITDIFEFRPGPIPGSGNIDAPPSFANADGGDFRLAFDSPCIDGGTNLPWMASATDLEGNRRIHRANGIVDIGCYEFIQHGTAIMVR